MTDSKTDLVSRAAMAAYEHDFSLVSDEAMGAAIAAVLDDLENPTEWMLEAFYRRFDEGHKDGEWQTLLGASLQAMLAAKRKSLGL